MASKRSFPEEDYTCPICCDIFKDPVLTWCSHSFCKDCLKSCWRDKTLKECPVCRRRSLSDNPPLNLSLRNLCESFQKEKSAGVCSLHGEEAKLFCLEDKQPICLVCQASRKHSGHQFLPIDEAALDSKEQLNAVLKPLQEKLKEFERVKKTCDQTARHIKVQARQSEQQIKEEFEMLHGFLIGEEQARISALKDEEEEKSSIMKEKIERLSMEMSSISDTISAIKKQMVAEDIIVLQNFKASMESPAHKLQKPQRVSGALIDVAKHLGNLTFRVWEKMKDDIIQFTPVLLDPNTASPWLNISADLTSLEEPGLTLQDTPDNPERFKNIYSAVLGTEGFSSRSHWWDVELGGSTNWCVGVTPESNQGRRDTFSWERVWGVGYDGSDYVENDPFGWDKIGPVSVLKQNLCTVRVHLDLDEGLVSFSDPLYQTHLHTFRLTFKEKVFPIYYSPRSPLSILPTTPIVL